MRSHRSRRSVVAAVVPVVASVLIGSTVPLAVASNFDDFGAGPMPSVVSAEWRTWIHEEVAARLAAFAFARDSTRYVSLDGDDDADGMTPETAWATIGAAAAWLAAPGGSDTRELLLRRGDVFHATAGLITTRAGTRIADYGDPELPKPRLSGFALRFVPPALPRGGIGDSGGIVEGWEAHPDFPDGRVASRVVDQVVHWVRQGGDEDFDSPMARMASVTQVVDTPGSFWFDAIEMRLWVHTRDATPVESCLIEGCVSSGNAVRISGDLSIVENIEAIGWGMDLLQQDPINSRANGSSRNAFVGCDAYYCFSHAISHATNQSGGSLTIVDCTAGFTSVNNPAGETIFNGFALQGGNDLLIHRSAALRGSLPSHDNGLSSARARAWFAHGNVGSPVGRVVVHDFSIPDHPWGCRDLGTVAHTPQAQTIHQVKAVAVDIVADGLQQGAIFGARNALVNARLRFRPVNVPQRALQTATASGYVVNSSIHIDLEQVTQGPRFGLYNNSSTGNAPKVWFSEIRAANTRDGLNMVIDYDGANSSPFASFYGSLFVRESDEGAFNLNVGPNSTVVANAYANVTAHVADPSPLVDPPIPAWGEPPTLASPQVGAAIMPPWTIATDQVGVARVTDTIGPFEPVESPCPADLDGNGVVDGADLGILLSLWGTDDPAADLDGNGTVDGADLGALLAAWGGC